MILKAHKSYIHTVNKRENVLTKPSGRIILLQQAVEKDQLELIPKTKMNKFDNFPVLKDK